MLNEVKSFLDKYKIKNSKVIVGFSAGPDSCALALLLNELKEKYNLKLILAYFNHGWREEALLEEQFTKDFADKINADYYIKKAPKNSFKTEEQARNLRYAFFEKTAKKFNTNIVFLAHNKNDNVETLIYRIIKGTSTKGLASIPENRDIYYRPLLNIEKKDILNYLKSKKQKFKKDSSNDDIKYKRNLIRKKILPLFEKINPNYINNINNLIKNSISTKNIVDKVILETENEIIQNNKIKRDLFISLSKDIRLEILNNFLGDKLKYRDSKNLLKFDDFIVSNINSKISVNKELFLVVKNNKIYITKTIKKDYKELSINKEGTYKFEDIILKIEKYNKKDSIFPSSNSKECYLNFDFPLKLRHRKQGDIFSPYGLKNGKMKLKDFFINEKIEQSKKDKFILLCKDKEVLWILGRRINEKYKVKNPECYKLTLEKIDG